MEPLKIININENEWVQLPERNSLIEFEQHLDVLDNYTFNLLYNELIFINKDCNDIHEIFKDKKYKLYKYDSEKFKIEDYNIIYCNEECCSNYGTHLVEEKVNNYYCKECYYDLIESDEEEGDTESDTESDEEESDEEENDTDTENEEGESDEEEEVDSEGEIYKFHIYNKLSSDNKHYLQSLFDKNEFADKLENIKQLSATYLPKDSLLIVKDSMIYIFNEVNYESKSLSEYETLVGFSLTNNTIYISS